MTDGGDERAALARLEDLGDLLEDRRGRRPTPAATRAAPSDSTGAGGEGRALLRSNVVVATGTTLSRLTGLLRVLVFGRVIGQGALADAYLIGNETPNIVYELLLGGVLSATLVPMFTSFLNSDDRDEGE